MSASSLTFYRYALPRRDAVPPREGVLIQCQQGHAEGWGEAAPLEGYSPDTLADTLRCIPQLSNTKPDQLPPALRCGLDIAQTACRAAATGQSLYAVLGGTSPCVYVPIARLITGEADTATLNEENFRCVKFKVGRHTLAEDIRRIRAALDLLPASVRVRLDANRAWGLAEARTFAEALPLNRIDYLEEPLRNVEECPTLAAETGIPLALDESLRDHTPATLMAWPGLKALVLKPSLLGGIRVCQTWRDWAARNGCACVISAMYESGVGIFALTALAAAWAPNIPAGLDTGAALLEDVITPRLLPSNGRIQLPINDNEFYRTIDFSKLEPIA